MASLSKPKSVNELHFKSNIPKGTGKMSSVKPRVSTAELEILKLEQESKTMEERLKVLKETLEKQKERRGSSSFVWKSGNAQKGSLNTYAMDVLAAKNASLKARYSGIGDELDAKRRLLVEKPTPRSSETSKKDAGFTAVSASKIAQNPSEHNAATILKPTPPLVAKPSTQSRKPISPDSALVGKPAVSSRTQPSDVSSKTDENDYISEPKVWKNEVKLWRVPTPACESPMENIPKELNREEIQLEESGTEIVSQSEENMNIATESAPHSLLDGRVDEEQNKKDFLAALNEWRNSGKSKKVAVEKNMDDHFVAKAAERDTLSPRPVCTASTGTETLPIQASSIDPLSVMNANKEMSGLSYTQKLLLNKYRQKQDIIKAFDIKLEDAPVGKTDPEDILEDDDFEIELLSMSSLDRRWTSKNASELACEEIKQDNESIIIIETLQDDSTTKESSRQMIVLESQ